MSKRKILVADDEYVMREGIKEALLDLGFDVTLAKDGGEALELLGRGSYAMVITDIKMPKASGMDVLKEARRRCPDIPVLMMTAYGTVDNAVEAMKVGAYDYILKPFSTEAIEKSVMQALQGGDKRLQSEDNGAPGNKIIITQNEKMLKVLQLAENVAASDATVLIHGESGTGKELLARFLHEKSPKNKGPFVAVNCAALPDNLLESELFGHEKGAFTGAATQKKGKFELAHGGTLLLDEISEMALSLQAKLLRVIQERVVDRVGGTKPVPIDIRIVATTNRDMRRLVSEERFREDLYYRINVFPLKVPPLRERVDDIATLAWHFISRYGNKTTQIEPEAVRRLEECPWHGNIRELENIIQRAILLAGDRSINESHLFFNENPEEDEAKQRKSTSFNVGMSVWEAEKELILKTLERYEDNRSKAAETLGITARTLRNKLKEYEICQDESEL